MTATKTTTPVRGDVEQQIAELHECKTRMLEEFSKVVVGQSNVLEELLITLFANGHNLLEGVPGLAKTLMINTLLGSWPESGSQGSSIQKPPLYVQKSSSETMVSSTARNDLPVLLTTWRSALYR